MIRAAMPYTRVPIATTEQHIAERDLRISAPIGCIERRLAKHGFDKAGMRDDLGTRQIAREGSYNRRQRHPDAQFRV
jgi:hypothetical protein